MASDTTEAFATRLSQERAEDFKQAVAETDVSRSDLLARAARYYLEQNPDEISSLKPNGHVDDFLSQAGVLPAEE